MDLQALIDGFIETMPDFKANGTYESAKGMVMRDLARESGRDDLLQFVEAVEAAEAAYTPPVPKRPITQKFRTRLVDGQRVTTLSDRKEGLADAVRKR